MTTLYKPVLIESAEQAEALPVGTVATHSIGPGAAVRVGYGLGWSMSGEEMSEPHEHTLGWTALVPIEAEECHSEDYGSYHLMEAVDGTKPFTAYLVDQEEA